MSPAPDWSSVLPESVDLFKALLRLETVNPPGNERVAAELLARLFAKEGIEHQLVETPSGRVSIVARVRGTGEAGPLLLNGHLDVVPVDRDAWTHDPFGAEEHDGCIWGRGAIDMKNMVAMSAMTLVLLARSGVTPRRDLIFAGVADEEAGCHHGSLYLVDKHPDLVRAEYVLNEVGGFTLHMGDSRFYPIQVAEKGICWFEMEATGSPGHGSMPRHDNAVVRLAEAIRALGRTRLPQHNRPVVEEFLRTLAAGAPFPTNRLMPLLLEPRLAGFLLDRMTKQDPEKEISLSAMLRNTASPTMLEGGQKVNVIPSRASVKVDGRTLPHVSVEQFLDEVRAVVGPHVKLKVLEAREGSVFSADTPLYRAIREAVREHDASATCVPYMITGFTDSYAYSKLGAVCYGFSPMRLPPGLNFTAMYHGHDERIPRDGYEWGQRVLHDLVTRFVAA